MPIHKVTQLTNQHYELFLLADPSKTVIDRYLPYSLIFGYYHSEQLLGIVALLPTQSQTIEIINLAVAETVQGQGIGEKLIRYALQYAKKHDYTTIEIGTGSTSFGPLYLYQKCGFRITAVEPDYFVTHYSEPIIENGLVLKDRLCLSQAIL